MEDAALGKSGSEALSEVFVDLRMPSGFTGRSYGENYEPHAGSPLCERVPGDNAEQPHSVDRDGAVAIMFWAYQH
jgi:hypothetical protein